MIDVLKIALVLVALYALISLAACAMQERLIFYPQPPAPAPPVAPPGWRVEPLPVTAADGTRLEGWFVRPLLPEAPRATVLYFGGNAEEVSWMSAAAPRFGPVSLVLVNYRGYGRSGGAPGEGALFADAASVFDVVAARPDVDARRVALHGRSLGSGVAVYLATVRKACGLVLTSPFDSVTAIARRTFPWLPVETLLRHRFDSAARAPSIEAPLLVFAGAADRVVPIEHSRALFAAWRGPKEFVELAGADHEDVASTAAYWAAIGAFIARCG